MSCRAMMSLPVFLPFFLPACVPADTMISCMERCNQPDRALAVFEQMSVGGVGARWAAAAAAATI